MSARDLWLRVQVGSTNVGVAAPVRIQQQLEGAVTTVAEVALAGTSPALATNTAVAIHHVNRTNAPEPNYDSRQLFAGIVNRISGVGAPHGVTLACTGALAKLRRTRPTDHALAGKTDIAVAREVLSFCGISYTAADISGWGYPLGTAPLHGADPAQVRPYWRAGQSGAAIIGELDRVFGCATIELGDGRIVRFPYSRAPYRYLTPVYAKTFWRGQAGVAFYGNERDRGDLDQIMNYWVVRGIAFTAGEDDPDEGCQFRYEAVANADHAALGPGVDVGPTEFASDLIDSEALAKAVATRLMQWHNREPDLLRIACGNDARVGPGALVLVKDASYGIDLATDKRYLVLGVTRDGDTMLLDCVGGPTGVVGSVISHLYRECNDTITDTGTNPGAYPAPDPSLPAYPGIEPVPPDLPESAEPPPPPNTFDPFVECTDLTSELTPGGGEPAEPESYISPSAVTTSNYRASGAKVAYHVDAAGDVDHIALGASGTLVVNDTSPVSAKDFANDRNMAAGPGVIVVSGEAYFVHDGSVLTIEVQGYDAVGATNDLGAELVAEPGALYTYTGAIGGADDIDYHFGIVLNTENSVPSYSPYAPANSCPELFRGCDNGGFNYGGGVRVGQWMPFSFAFDFSGEYQRIDYAMAINAITDGTVGLGEIAATPGAALVEGHMEDLRSITVAEGLEPEEQHYEVCSDPVHRLILQATGTDPAASEAAGDPATWQVRLRSIHMGHTTCIPNPDFVPPITDGGGF